MEASRWACIVLLSLFAGAQGRSNINIYDVLRLMYRMCEADSASMGIAINCVELLLGGSGGEISEAAEKCTYKAENETPENLAPLEYLCSRYTQIAQWKSKTDKPPTSLTGVISIAGLTRMMCILADVQRPVLTWGAAFSKCFPRKQDKSALAKLFQKRRQ